MTAPVVEAFHRRYLEMANFCIAGDRGAGEREIGGRPGRLPQLSACPAAGRRDGGAR
jgi:hypothetical protein